MSHEHKIGATPPFGTVVYLRDWLDKGLEHLVNTKCQEFTFSELNTLISGQAISIHVDGQPIVLPDGAALTSLTFSKIKKADTDADVPEIALTFAEADTLIALVLKGPLSDGDLPSKSARDSLIEKGLAMRVMCKGEDGYQAATYEGRDVYNKRYCGNVNQPAMAGCKTPVPLRGG